MKAIGPISPSSARPRPPTPAHPIDAFIQERLARAGLHPSPEADRRTLIRRVTLDLTGLPPTPEETAAFLKDASPNAYDRLVDRLLMSPQYAEQQAMHWLDAVRYADTCGFHGDNAFPAWPYRDYVLHAFRDNKPFDEFTREQLAGDLMLSPTADQRVASAYNRLNRTSAEGGLQPKEYLAKYAADRVRTTVAVWMGSTLGCAECHDHKFDPFTQRDFYAMKAFFADLKETGLVPDRGRNAWGSQLALPTPDQQKREESLRQQLSDARAQLAAKMPKASKPAAPNGKKSFSQNTIPARSPGRPSGPSPRNRPTEPSSRSTTTSRSTSPSTTAPASLPAARPATAWSSPPAPIPTTKPTPSPSNPVPARGARWASRSCRMTHYPASASPAEPTAW